MFPEVELKCVARPSTLNFHDVEGDPLKEVFECSSNANSVSVQAVKSCCLSEFIEVDDKCLSCHWPITFLCLVSKQGTVEGGIIDFDVLVERV